MNLIWPRWHRLSSKQINRAGAIETGPNTRSYSGTMVITAPPVTIWTHKLIFYLDNKTSPMSPILAMYGDANWFNWSSQCWAVGIANLFSVGTWWVLMSVWGKEIRGCMLCFWSSCKGRVGQRSWSLGLAQSCSRGRGDEAAASKLPQAKKQNFAALGRPGVLLACLLISIRCYLSTVYLYINIHMLDFGYM